MTWIEIAGFVCGVIGVWLTLRENVWCFPIGLANVIFSLFLFFQQKLYADALQQFVYILLLGYGWMTWIRRDESAQEIKISESSNTLLLVCSTLFILCTIVLGTLLSKLTDAAFPWLDSTATALSFIAQWMIAKKKIENWLIWIVVNIMYIGIYSCKELWLYSTLFSIYLLLAISGYITWRKTLKMEASTV